MQVRFSAKAERVECVGGWSFLLLVLGIFCLLPGTIVTGIYVRESIPAYRMVALVMFCVALTLVLIGIFLCVYWCTRSSTSQHSHKYSDINRTRSDADTNQNNVGVTNTTEGDTELATAEEGLVGQQPAEEESSRLCSEEASRSQS